MGQLICNLISPFVKSVRQLCSRKQKDACQYDLGSDEKNLHFPQKLNSYICYTGSPHFTRFHFARSSLYTKMMFLSNEFTLFNALHDFLTLHCQKTLSELYLSTKASVFHFTRISLYTIYFEKQKSCKVRATCIYIL